VKKRFLSAALLLALAALPLSAQSTQTAQPAASTQQPTDANPAAAPGEPEIVMPQVILQIEDLSVEKVEAQLPPEEDLLPPERTIPVMNEGDLAVGEPQIPASAVDTEAGARQQADRFLTSEVQLGAGSQNMITGSMSLKTLGQDPRFSLQFNHETLDGFAGHDPGSGFNLRDDGLNGGLKFRLGAMDTDITGSFSENENGLQSNPAGVPYNTALARSLAANASFSASPLEWLALNAAVGAGYDSLTLEGSTPLPVTGLHVAPTLSAEARFGVVKIGLDTSYWYRSETMSSTDQLNRFQVGSTFHIDLPATFILEGSAAWFWNSAGLSLFPFTLSATGTPFAFLTMSLTGGYKVVPYELNDMISAHSLASPDLSIPLADDRGWFADASVQLTLTRDLAVTTKLSFMASEAMPVGSTSLDAATGLYTIAQQQGLRLDSDVGLRWGISQSFSLSAGWTQEYLTLPLFASSYAITVELIGLEPTGKFGGNFSIVVSPIVTGLLQLPVVRLSGFWKISDVVKLQLDCDDLLWPLLGGPRWDVAPDTYVTPGFRIAGSLSMSL
jgi:hypothetical protein